MSLYYCWVTKMANAVVLWVLVYFCVTSVNTKDSNMTDDSLSEKLSPENDAQGGQTTALDIVLDTDHLDYSDLGNVDPDLNILLDNNSINCRYFTEMEFNNNSFIDTNFPLFNLNLRSLPKNYVNLHHFLEGLNIRFYVLSFTETWLSEYNKS